MAWTRSDRQVSWSAILENSSGPNAESSVQVDGGGDEEPVAPLADSAKPRLASSDCRKFNSDCGVSSLAVAEVDGVVAPAVLCVAVVDAVAASDEGVELTAFVTDVCDPLLPSFDSRLANSVPTVFVELLVEREFQLMPILKLTPVTFVPPRLMSTLGGSVLVCSSHEGSTRTMS